MLPSARLRGILWLQRNLEEVVQLPFIGGIPQKERHD